MSHNKSPGNDGITREFYETFLDELEILPLASIDKAIKVGEPNTSQKQAVIKLIEKKYKDKRFMKNWRLIYI